MARPILLERGVGSLRIASRPALCRVILRDLLHRDEPRRADETHLRGAMAWLARAQDHGGGDGGLSAGYAFRRGWLPPYPEITGYTIPTLLRYAQLSGDGSWVQRAVRAGDWEIAAQLPDGGVGDDQGAAGDPVVFNTGQVLLGWCALCRHTGQGRYLDAAMRAGDWLVRVQDRDGSWRRFTYEGVPHAHHARVAWPLLELAAMTGEDRYRAAAVANLRWVLNRARANGWVEAMAFPGGDAPDTHTIAYTYRGLFESSRLLEGGADDDGTGMAAERLARLGAERLLRRFELNTPDPHTEPWPLAAALDEHWLPADDSTSCVPGNAQVALLWLRLAAADGGDVAAALRWTNSALKLLDQVKSAQTLRSRHTGLRGGLPGSLPVWGWYLPFTYPTWAAKFFVDALLALPEAEL